MIDNNELQEILQLFYEESDDGLNTMESGLLSLTDGEFNSDVINNIFRAAHSIKGGAATFGLSAIADFTHFVETLLDEMREQIRPINSGPVNLMLKGVDCIRELFEMAKLGNNESTEQSQQILADIKKILEESVSDDLEKSEETESTDSTETESSSENSTDQQSQNKSENDSKIIEWKISFTPKSEFMKSGNKPDLILRELNSLGDTKINTICDQVPSLETYDPTDCYLSWEITLKTEASKEKILEVFEWVDDVCELAINPANIDKHSEQGPDTLDSEVTSEQKEKEVQDVKPEIISSEEQKPASPENTQEKKPAAKSNAVVPANASIRVDITKIDQLLNLVGELVITQSMLKKSGEELAEVLTTGFETSLQQLESNARQLQEVAMNMRMLPIKNTFSRFPRMVHDLSTQLGKNVELTISGENTELDKTVLEKVKDPLVHLVRNALDHGIEKPDERVAAGKSELGTIHLSASHEAGNILISISDNGNGINPKKVLNKAISRGLVKEGDELSVEEINDLVFKPGFSTAEVVSDLSGRGVGMDVVRSNIEELGGRVEVTSVFGEGSTFRIRLPLTMAILDGQLIRVGSGTYVIPLLNIIESTVINMNKISTLNSEYMVYNFRDINIPMIVIDQIFKKNNAKNQSFDINYIKDKIMMIVDVGDEMVGLIVDELLDQQQVVIKSLDKNYHQLDGLSGATILGDGTVALIIDIPGLIKKCYRKPKTNHSLSRLPDHAA